jgi:hypothetical protein
LSPPSAGIGASAPPVHAKPRQTLWVVLGKNAEQLQSSPFGWSSAVSAMPATSSPRGLWPGHATLLFGPPSVPRSASRPSRHTAA